MTTSHEASEDDPRRKPQPEDEDPWLTIWYKPRGTIRRIIDTNPQQHILLLVMIAGIGEMLARASWNSWGDTLSVPVIFGMALVLGPVVGVLELYIGGALLRWAGSWFGGVGNVIEVRAAIAWSSVPSIWRQLLWIPELILFGREMFTTATPRIDASPILSVLLLMFGVVEIVTGVWAVVIYLKCLGEAHRFSAWRALGAVLAIVLPVLALLVGCSLLTLL